MNNNYVEVLFEIIDNRNELSDVDKALLKNQVKKIIEAEVQYEFNEDRSQIPKLIDSLLSVGD